MTITIYYTSCTYKIELYVSGDNSDMYPKSTKTRNRKVWDSSIQAHSFVGVEVQAILQPDSINKGANEGGLKRLVSFVKAAKKIHGSIQFERKFVFGNDTELPSFIIELA